MRRVILVNLETKGLEPRPALKTSFEYRSLAYEREMQEASIAYEVKSVRAVWDPDIAGGNGGWRCPPGTQNAGRWSDRFGRNCGLSVVRRIGNALSDTLRGLKETSEDRKKRRSAAKLEKNSARAARLEERAKREAARADLLAGKNKPGRSTGAGVSVKPGKKINAPKAKRELARQEILASQPKPSLAGPEPKKASIPKKNLSGGTSWEEKDLPAPQGALAVAVEEQIKHSTIKKKKLESNLLHTVKTEEDPTGTDLWKEFQKEYNLDALPLNEMPQKQLNAIQDLLKADIISEPDEKKKAKLHRYYQFIFNEKLNRAMFPNLDPAHDPEKDTKLDEAVKKGGPHLEIKKATIKKAIKTKNKNDLKKVRNELEISVDNSEVGTPRHTASEILLEEVNQAMDDVWNSPEAIASWDEFIHAKVENGPDVNLDVPGSATLTTDLNNPSVATDVMMYDEAPAHPSTLVPDDVLFAVKDAQVFDPKVASSKDWHQFFKDSNGKPLDPNDKSNRFGSFLIDKNTGKVILMQPKDNYGGYGWTVSKGGPDDGESPFDTAVREVKEETGMDVQIIDAFEGGWDGYYKTYMFVGLVDFKPEQFEPTREVSALKAVSFGEELQAHLDETTYEKGKLRDKAMFSALDAQLKELYGGMNGWNVQSLEMMPSAEGQPKLVPEIQKVDTPNISPFDAGLPKDPAEVAAKLKEKKKAVKALANSIGLKPNSAFGGATPGADGKFEFTAVDGIKDANAAYDALENGINGETVTVHDISDSVLAEAIMKSATDGKRFKRLGSSAGVNDWLVGSAEHAKGTWVVEDTITKQKYILKTPVRDDFESTREVNAALVSAELGLPTPIPRLLGEMYVQKDGPAPGSPNGKITKGDMPETHNRALLIEHLGNVVKPGDDTGPKVEQVGIQLAQQYLIGEPDNHGDNRISIGGATFAFDAGKAFTPWDPKFGDEKFGGGYANALHSLPSTQQSEALKATATALERFNPNSWEKKVRAAAKKSNANDAELAAMESHITFVRARHANWREAIEASYPGASLLDSEGLTVTDAAEFSRKVKESTKESLAVVRDGKKNNSGLSKIAALMHDGLSIRGRRVAVQDGFKIKMEKDGVAQDAVELRVTLSDAAHKDLLAKIDAMPDSQKFELDTTYEWSGSFPLMNRNPDIPMDPEALKAMSNQEISGSFSSLSIYNVKGNDHKIRFVKLDDDTVAVVYPKVVNNNTADERDPNISRLVRVFSVGDTRNKVLSDPNQVGITLEKIGVQNTPVSAADARTVATNRLFSSIAPIKKDGKILTMEEKKAHTAKVLKKHGLSLSDIEVEISDQGAPIPVLSDAAAQRLYDDIKKENPLFGTTSYMTSHNVSFKGNDIEDDTAKVLNLLTFGGIVSSADRFISNPTYEEKGSSSEDDIGKGSGNAAYWSLGKSYVVGNTSNSSVNGISGGIVTEDPVKMLKRLDYFINTNDAFGSAVSAYRVEDPFQHFKKGANAYELVHQNNATFDEVGAIPIFGSGGGTQTLDRLVKQMDDLGMTADDLKQRNFLYGHDYSAPSSAEAGTLEYAAQAYSVEIFTKDGKNHYRALSNGVTVHDSSTEEFKGAMKVGMIPAKPADLTPKFLSSEYQGISDSDLTKDIVSIINGPPEFQASLSAGTDTFIVNEIYQGIKDMEVDQMKKERESLKQQMEALAGISSTHYHGAGGKWIPDSLPYGKNLNANQKAEFGFLNLRRYALKKRLQELGAY